MNSLISHFPMPYPDEWWYSVLCRYYIRSGSPNYQDIFLELFGNKKQKLERLIPNGTHKMILDRLPEIGFTSNDVLFHHTILPCYLRFYPYAQRMDMYQAILAGHSIKVRVQWPSPPGEKEGIRYCPRCYEEDQKMYGEPYWHREHQIPLMPICPKHQCHLQTYPIRHSIRCGQFLPLCTLPIKEEEKTELKSWEKPLADMLMSFLCRPLEDGPTDGYNNLYDSLLAMGPQYRCQQKKDLLRCSALCKKCLEYYGKPIYAQYFSSLSSCMLGYIRDWKARTPERYALLAVLCGLTADELFGKDMKKWSTRAERLMQCWNEGKVYTKKELAAIVGVGTLTLDMKDTQVLAKGLQTV